MRSPRNRWILLVLATLFLLSTQLVQAQQPVTFVSRSGSDVFTCTRIAPCRTINRGLDAVATNGAVIVLDSALYKPFTVNKAATVSADPGATPVVLGTAGAKAVSVTASAGSVVVIRGLTIRGAFDSLASNGVSGGTSATLHIEDCDIVGFSIGIGYTSSGPLTVKDTTIKSCSSGVQTATTRALFVNSRIENNGTGYLVGSGSKATIRDSILTGNLQALTAGGAGTELVVDGCTVTNNNEGIRSDSPGTIVRVANTIVSGNVIGLGTLGSGALLSRLPATNTIEGNTTNGAFTGTYTAK